jgi:hypothetical protein
VADTGAKHKDLNISPRWGIGFWAAFGLLLAILAFIVVLLVRSGFFNFSNSISNDQYKALWTFLASALVASVTLIGLTLTYSHNMRTVALQADSAKRQEIAERESEDRLKLETVVKSLELVSAGPGAYAVSAQVAGSLAALVHLGHPVIAMRALRAAWHDKGVDVATAVWLINEVLERGTPVAQIEASYLLSEHANELCYEEGRDGEFEWPEILHKKWIKDAPRACRLEIFSAIVAVLISRDKSWWGYTDGWAVVLFYEAMTVDPDPVLRDCACHLARPIIESYPTKDVRLPWGDDLRELAEIERSVRNYQGCGRITVKTTMLEKELESWLSHPETDDGKPPRNEKRECSRKNPILSRLSQLLTPNRH